MKPLRGTSIHILALETGHLSAKAISGGDILLEKMAPYFPRTIKLSVIIPKTSFPHWQKQKSVKIYYLPKNYFESSINKFFVLLSYLFRSFWTFVLLRNIKFDIIYSSANVLPDVFPAYLYKKIHPKKSWIARVHHLVPSPRQREGNLLVNFVAYLLQGFILKLIKNANLIIALNEPLYQTLKKLGVRKAKLAILGGGVDIAKIQEIRPKGPSYDGVFVGRLHPTKGVFDLIDIWLQVVKIRPEAKLAIIGEGRTQILKEMQENINSSNLSKNIDLLGYLPQKKLYQTLKNSKIFLFTDKEAGWGLAVAEAMAAGLPVVAYNLPIFGDIYRKGFVTVSLEDTASFAKKVIKLLDNQKLQKRLSYESLDQANKLSWPKSAKTFQNLVENLIRNP